MPILPRNRQCTGCMACVDSCAKGAISMVVKDGINYPAVNTQICIECGSCSSHCPQLNDTNGNFRKDVKVFGGWCKDIKVRKKAASGGAFSAFAMSVLKEGGYVVGASLNEEGNVEHRIITSINDLSLLQNSKYVQSDTSGIYKQVKSLLNEGKFILFSGTPCQIGAINSFLGKPYENLLTVDVVCNGVPAEIARHQLFEETDAQRILSFRDKEFGWVELKSQKIVYQDKKGRTISCGHDTDPFYRIFGTGVTHRDTCNNCKYSSFPRYSDITIADFWGIKRFKEEWQDGISLIVVNNPKGMAFLDSCKEISVFEASLEECLPANPRLVNGKKYLSWHPIVRWRHSAHRLLGKNVYLKIVQNRYPYRLLWGALKVFTIIANKKAIRKELRYEKNRYYNNL